MLSKPIPSIIGRVITNPIASHELAWARIRLVHTLLQQTSGRDFPKTTRVPCALNSFALHALFLPEKDAHDINLSLAAKKTHS